MVARHVQQAPVRTPIRRDGGVMSHETIAAVPRARTSFSDTVWIARSVNIHAAWFRLARVTIWPFIDLGIRIWLAQIFFVSGVLKVTNWHTALDLAATEYPVSWMDPVTAAYTGAAIEVICPVFLAAGLMTRYAAVPMLVLSTTGPASVPLHIVSSVAR